MAINFGFNSNNNNNVNALNLQKNDILDLTKKNPGLKRVILGAGWDVATMGQDFDLDIAAFLIKLRVYQMMLFSLTTWKVKE